MDAEQLPRVVLTTTASVDGRITLGSHQRLVDPTVAERWNAMKPVGIDGLFRRRQTELASHVTLEGSGSFVDVDAATPEWPASEGVVRSRYRVVGPSHG